MCMTEPASRPDFIVNGGVGNLSAPTGAHAHYIVDT
jgi:hypothetical protein